MGDRGPGDPDVTRSTPTGRALVFDVNETLLDLSPLRDVLRSLLGEPDPFELWFARTLHWTAVLSLIGRYEPMSRIGAEALREIAARRGVRLPDDAGRAVADRTRTLPAHGDVAPSLALAREAGFAVAALTNSPQELVDEQLAAAGLANTFDAVMSVAGTGRFKPAPETYGSAAVRLGVDPSETWMVAAHDWDVLGAMRAGFRGAYVARSGPHSALLDPPPDVVGPDLIDVVERIVGVRPR